MSLCNIKAKNKLPRSHCTIEIPRGSHQLRRNVTSGKAPLLHPPSPSTTLSTPSESKIVHTAPAEATALSRAFRFSRRLPRMNLLGTPSHRVLRQQQCDSLLSPLSLPLSFSLNHFSVRVSARNAPLPFALRRS